MREQRRYNFTFSFNSEYLALTFQIQYYWGDEYHRSSHWGIGFGLFFPPFILLKGKEVI